MSKQNIFYFTALLLGGLILMTSAKASIKETTHYTTQPIRTLGSFPSLPIHERDTKFQSAQKGFEDRSNLFLKGKHFQNWSANKNQNETIEEFKRIEDWRNHSWYAEGTGELLVSRIDFMVAQDLLEKGFYRKPHLIAFQYNQADGSYNASLIALNGQRFLALEAPTAKNVNQFYKLLQNFQVTQLVRLAPEAASNEKQSFAYWQGRIKKNTKSSEQFMHVPLAGIQKTFPIHYYFTNSWQDGKGMEPQALLNLIQSVRKNMDTENGLMACHCTNGVGRTGTFIAGLLLLQEIDRQLAAGVSIDQLDISIEKIVMQLSLQRLYMVGKADQYITLYRLVDLYIDSIKNK